MLCMVSSARGVSDKASGAMGPIPNRAEGDDHFCWMPSSWPYDGLDFTCGGQYVCKVRGQRLDQK